MNHPIIGISGSHNVADRQMFVRENYMQSVLRAGGIPVLLPEVGEFQGLHITQPLEVLNKAFLFL